MIVENFKMAMDSIVANKMRSFLTMLGIIIGTASVISILSVGNGATEEMTQTFADIGATTISLAADPDQEERDLITLEDLDFLKENIDEIEHLSPPNQINGRISSNQSGNQFGFLTFGTPDLQYLNAQMEDTIVHGRYFNQNDLQVGNDVAIVDSDTAQRLFNRTDVVGESIQFTARDTTLNFTIIGVMEGRFSELQGEFAEEGMPVFIAAPLSTIENYFPIESRINNVLVQVTNTSDIGPVSNQMVRLLELRHDQAGQDTYTATNFLNALNQLEGLLGLFINFIAAVAGIALLVGGIGVMNIMLVSVTERTREIGVRKALGATTGNILGQFLMESLIISLLGGLIGLVIGIVASNLIASALNITTSLTLGAVLLALGFSSGVGIFFGYYPARKAANLNPIDALRHE